jgi:outer membrane protein OmpA-like peptidoglycan-associated protein
MPRFGILLGAVAIALGVGSGAGWAQAPAGRSDEPVGKVFDITGTVLGIGSEVLDIVGLASEIKGIDLGIPGSHVTVTPKEIRIELPADILFDFDKADIRPGAADALKRAAIILRERAKGPVRIEGHTDSKGNSPYNQKLSERRAGSVRTWLVEREGLHDIKFEILGFGATRPKVPNTKPDGSDDVEAILISPELSVASEVCNRYFVAEYHPLAGAVLEAYAADRRRRRIGDGLRIDGGIRRAPLATYRRIGETRPPRRRNRRLRAPAQRFGRARQMDVHNRARPRQTRPRLPRHRQRVIIPVQSY